MNKRINRVKVSLGGAIKRKNPSKASLLYNKLNLINGRVLDYGCGYGLDAKVNKWESYDPYYNDIKLDGLYDTIVCTNVLSAVSSKIRSGIIENIRELLKDDGIAYFAMPRNLPIKGKLSGYARRPQNYVILTLESIYKDNKIEIYKFLKNSKYIDKTKNIME
jgi:2-polyprenyl-3-methyl-5-hydroxy-6-metoxy-1,4-benzoquinol methylase